MSDMKIAYIFRGAGRNTIVKGDALMGDDKKSFNVRHRGIFFAKKVLVKGVELDLIGEEKQLCFGDKIEQSWRCREVYMDYLTGKPFCPDINPELIAKINHLRNENEALRKRVATFERLFRYFDNNKMFAEKMKEWMKAAGDARSQIFTGDSFGGGFGFRPPFGGGGD